MDDALVVETRGLCKNYGGVHALRGLDLEVPAGSIFGLLGKNGAGKTTAIKLLLGMVRPTAGHAQVFGLRADAEASSVEIRRRTGFVSEDKDLYDTMDVDDMLRFTEHWYPRWRPDLARRCLHAFELPQGRKVKTLSRGMRTKLALLLALCRGAELLILDEPTSGLDPAVADQVLRVLVAHVADLGTTVVFSSHQIPEVEQIADRIAIIDRGRAALTGTLDDLRERFRRIELVFDREAPDARITAPGVVRVRRKGRVLTVLSSAGAERILDETRALAPVSVEVCPVALKDIFLETVAAED